MTEKGMHTRFWLEDLKGKDHLTQTETGG